MTPEEYYSGKCPVGGEVWCPKEKLSFDTEIMSEPYVNCALHGCRVPMGVISKEEHDKLWEKWGQG